MSYVVVARNKDFKRVMVVSDCNTPQEALDKAEKQYPILFGGLIDLKIMMVTDQF